MSITEVPCLWEGFWQHEDMVEDARLDNLCIFQSKCSVSWLNPHLFLYFDHSWSWYSQHLLGSLENFHTLLKIDFNHYHSCCCFIMSSNKSFQVHFESIAPTDWGAAGLLPNISNLSWWPQITTFHFCQPLCDQPKPTTRALSLVPAFCDLSTLPPHREGPAFICNQGDQSVVVTGIWMCLGLDHSREKSIIHKLHSPSSTHTHTLGLLEGEARFL